MGRTEGRYILRTKEFNIGLGLLLKNYWNTEFEYFYRKDSFLPEDVEPEKYSINAGISLSAQLDLLDDVLLPWNGILLNGKYENSSIEWGSNNNYHFYQGSGDIYFTQKRNTYRLMGYYHQALNNFHTQLYF